METEKMLYQVDTATNTIFDRIRKYLAKKYQLRFNEIALELEIKTENGDWTELNLNSLYIELTDDLSYARTFFPGTPVALDVRYHDTDVDNAALADYQRRYTVQELSADGLRDLATTVTAMADAEGLTAHKRAVTIRMDVINQEPRS